MIWRLPHPVRGLAVSAAVLLSFVVVAGLAGGVFGIGLPEMVVILTIAAGAGYAAARDPRALRQDDAHARRPGR